MPDSSTLKRVHELQLRVTVLIGVGGCHGKNPALCKVTKSPSVSPAASPDKTYALNLESPFPYHKTMN